MNSDGRSNRDAEQLSPERADSVGREGPRWPVRLRLLKPELNANRLPVSEVGVAADRFLPPADVQSIRAMAEWMRESSIDTQSDEAVTIVLNDGRLFDRYFIERCCEAFLLVTRYLDEGDINTPEEQSHKAFLALDWAAIAGLRWTTARVKTRPQDPRLVNEC